MTIAGRILRFMAERSAKGRGYAELAETLESGKTTVQKRLQRATDNERNRNTASHVIGIERWGVHRLQSLLGLPLVMDEYDGYRPGKERSMAELADDFVQTRQDLLSLLRTLEDRKIALSQTTPHNEIGPLSAGAWIAYLNSHANRESRRIR